MHTDQLIRNGPNRVTNSLVGLSQMIRLLLKEGASGWTQTDGKPRRLSLNCRQKEACIMSEKLPSLQGQGYATENRM